MARKFKNEPISTLLAWVQARKALVPLVVVITIIRPPTLSLVNSRGELPKSNAMLPVRLASMRTPLRSPASSSSGCRFRRARASAISSTGIAATAPLASAVTIVLVARSTSNTTQTVSRKSRPFNAVNSAGAKSASRLRFFSIINRSPHLTRWPSHRSPVDRAITLGAVRILCITVDYCLNRKINKLILLILTGHRAGLRPAVPRSRRLRAGPEQEQEEQEQEEQEQEQDVCPTLLPKGRNAAHSCELGGRRHTF